MNLYNWGCPLQCWLDAVAFWLSPSLQFPPDKGIASLFLVLRTVEELKLKKLKHMTGKGLHSVSSKTLRSVNLRESSSLTDSGVKALVQSCPNIEVLNLSELHKLTDVAIIAAAESLKDKLVSLSQLVLLLISSTLNFTIIPFLMKKFCYFLFWS